MFDQLADEVVEEVSDVKTYTDIDHKVIDELLTFLGCNETNGILNIETQHKSN